MKKRNNKGDGDEKRKERVGGNGRDGDGSEGGLRLLYEKSSKARAGEYEVEAKLEVVELYGGVLGRLMFISQDGKWKEVVTFSSSESDEERVKKILYELGLRYIEIFTNGFGGGSDE